MAKFSFRQTGRREVIEVDGEDISHTVTSMTLKSRPNEPARVSLELVVFEVDAGTDDARIHVGEESAALLKRLGWTPPSEEI